MDDALVELLNLFSAIDRAFAEVHGRFAGEVRCGRGCDDCCHAVFDLSLVEAVHLAGHFLSLDQELRKVICGRAAQALEEWQNLRGSGGQDPALARIRCPLLDEKGECLCYQARPVNCRSYGIPTVINGAGHVCGYSGFEQGRSYPTVNLGPIQQALYGLSVRTGGEVQGIQRWPVAAVLLDAFRFVGMGKE